MLNDSRTKAKVLRFLSNWLGIKTGPELVKDKTQFPEFSQEVAVAMRTSMRLFLNDVVWKTGSDYRRFFTEETVYLNDSIAPLFNIDLKKDSSFHPVRINGGQRAGIITPSLYTEHAVLHRQHITDTSRCLPFP